MPSDLWIEHPNDSDRCTEMTHMGQCNARSLEGTKKCRLHSPLKEYLEKKAEIRNYRLTKWKDRLDAFADHSQVKSLRDEVGLLRIMIEEIWNQCHNSTDLLINVGRIADLITRVEKVVSSCHRLEEKTNMMLDKTSILTIATTIIQIITVHVKDETTIDAIATDITNTIAKQVNNPQ